MFLEHSHGSGYGFLANDTSITIITALESSCSCHILFDDKGAIHKVQVQYTHLHLKI